MILLEEINSVFMRELSGIYLDLLLGVYCTENDPLSPYHKTIKQIIKNHEATRFYSLIHSCERLKYQTADVLKDLGKDLHYTICTVHRYESELGVCSVQELLMLPIYGIR